MKNLSLIARILFAIPMAMFGLGHFMQADMMVSMVPIPGGLLWVYLTGACLLAASVAIITGNLLRLATLLLGVLLLTFAFTVHLPNMLGGDSMAMVSFMKDLSLAGGSFFIASKSS